MADFFRFIGENLVRLGSPEDIDDRRQNPQEQASAAPAQEALKREERENFINTIKDQVVHDIQIAEQELIKLRGTLQSYAKYENYRKMEIERVMTAGDTIAWKGGLDGPNEEDWRGTLQGLHEIGASTIDWAETCRLIQQAFAESGNAEGSDRLSAAIFTLGKRRADLEKEHGMRNGQLWEMYARLQQELANNALQDVYGTKRAEFEEEEVELKRLARAKDFLTQKREARRHLFEAS